MSSEFFSRDPSFQPFGRECLFKYFCSGFLCRDFWVVISLQFCLRKNFLFRDFLEEVPLQNFFVRELVNHPFEILGTDFSAEIFW